MPLRTLSLTLQPRIVEEIAHYCILFSLLHLEILDYYQTNFTVLSDCFQKRNANGNKIYTLNKTFPLGSLENTGHRSRVPILGIQ